MMRQKLDFVKISALILILVVYSPYVNSRLSNLDAALTTPKPLLASGTNKCVVILIEFSDVPRNKINQDFQDLLFSTGTYSMTDYFRDVSYDNLTVTGTVWGWYPAPQSRTRSYYADDKSGRGDYPNNSQGLVKDALDELTKTVSDFSEYDKDGDGFVDALFVVYSGYCDPYRTKNRDLIIPHKWELSADGGPGAYEVDYGYKFDEYVVLPEISLNAYDYTIYDSDIVEVGIFCYHYGSILGLPYLSDKSIDPGTGEYNSYGLGDYCLMSNDYLGENRYDRNSGLKPFHLCAWSKCYMGWIDFEEYVIEDNASLLEIVNVEENPMAYKVIANPSLKGESEYFLIENRQKKGFDSGLFGSGLLIYHVDETVGIGEGTPNNDVEHKLVDLEEADGKEDIDYKINFGDPDDFFGNGDTFDSNSNPNSNTYPNEKNTEGRRIAFSLSVVSVSTSAITVNIDVKKSDQVAVVGDPNIFTPNGDGFNDNIIFKQASGTYDFSIHIYDSLGRKINEISNNAWDGTDGIGRTVSGGVYIYQIEYEDGTISNGTVVVAK